MGGIFISYRREDSAGWTGRLAEHLREVFGAESIFMDIDTIQPGENFTEALQTAVSSCDVLLAMIGPGWATATDKSGKLRLEDPTDWVRVEIAAALARKIRVVPVLVGGASIPTMDLLPDELDPLAQRQAHELTDRRWNYDVEQLVKTLPTARQKPPPHLEATSAASSAGSLRWAMLAMLVIAVITAWIVFNASPRPQDDIPHTVPQNASEVPSPQKPSAKPELARPKLTAPSHIIHLRAGQEARLKDHRATCLYTVLALQVDHARPDILSLNVTVRVTNEGPSDTGFGDGNFRLLVDDVPRAPTNRLIDSIDPHSAKEATIVFAFPVTAQRLVLQLRMGTDIAEFPIDITKPIPSTASLAASTQIARFGVAKFPISLRAGQETRLKDHRATCLYTVLALQVDHARPDILSLNVTVRVTNEGPSDTGFGDGNFRLLVDDVPRAPTNRLIDSIDPHSAKEATIVFAFPVTAQRLVLQLRMGKEVSEFPLNLTPL